MKKRTIVWFRGKDLRMADHLPLHDAIHAGDVVPVFVLDPYFFMPTRARDLPNRIQFLLESLQSLSEDIASKGSHLVLVHGKSVDVIPRLVREWRIDSVLAYRWVEPFARERDRRIHEILGKKFVLYEGETLRAPGTLRTQAGKPFSVFSQFSRSFFRSTIIDKPILAPQEISSFPDDILFEKVKIPTCEDLGFHPNRNILVGGECAAKERLIHFIKNAATTYDENRNRMDLPGTSRISVDLKFGTLSIRQVWYAIIEACDDSKSRQSFLNELIWREFTHSTLWDRPDLLDNPFQASFQGFPWHDDEILWKAWVEGKTGYPVVDASSRQLLREGFVHNRARMISASFLTKHLLIDYKKGEAHYMKYLTDGDWAQNNSGWQWSAGCGCDAQPYFRIFNPMTQGKKFDPEGHYVRKYIPELAQMPVKYIHAPWEAPDHILREAGVILDKNYPKPVVDHRVARDRFLSTVLQHRGKLGLR